MIVGIDLGTTFSLISYVQPAGTPTLCPSQGDERRFQTASVVHIGERGCLVGDLVEELLAEEPRLPVARFVKLRMGKTQEPVYHDHQGRGYPPEAISALILRKLKEDAEAATGEAITAAVITVPAHFNDAQRRATLNAGRLADIPVLGLVEEPLAAATYVGLNTKGRERLIFVFDLGGGTLDATILTATPEGLYAIATEGSDNIGGKNFDELIMNIVLEQFRGQFQTDLREDPESLQRIRAFATSAKIALSEPENDRIQRPLAVAGKSLRVNFTRNQFEEAAQPWLEACQEVCDRVLHSKGLHWADIDELVLTGGSSLVPCVERKVREMSGLPPGRVRRHQPHAAIAYGAALLAEQFHGQRATSAPPLKQMVTSNELGLRAFDPRQNKPVFHLLIEKNLPLPATYKQTFYTRTAEQTHFLLDFQQRKNSFAEIENLGRFRFGSLARPHVDHPLEVEVRYDNSGRVQVTAHDPEEGRKVDHEFASDDAAELAGIYPHLQRLAIRA